ncbi:MAG: S41 family peptidase [Rhizobiales bacterium]|nr:S41 family peptidase [Hyphomicrobiales bacterium]NRB14674.1 S41 family peptidase [Hyphomicrobiales bacterium]
MKKSISLGALLVIVGLFSGIFIAPVFSEGSEDKPVNYAEDQAEKAKNSYDHLIRFGNILDIIEKTYVDQPDIDKIMNEAIAAVVASLDPHSEYLDPESYKQLMEQTSGSFGGLGIRVQLNDGLVKAVKVLEDTPAERAGLKDDDLITKIDDTEVMGLTLDEAVDLMRGEVGTPIELMVKRDGETELLKFNLNREIIKLNPVTSEVIDNVGYLVLSSFNELAETNLKKAIDKITKAEGENLKGFILDLRGNGGGLLNQAVYVSDLFLKQGEITSTRGRDENQTFRFSAETKDQTDGQNLVVLINGETASSSEIVSGALQDYERATLIGTRSFGKGSVQTIIPLGDDNSALRITTARYYTPSGRSIQAQGILPDWVVMPIIADGISEQLAEVKQSEATLEGHLANEKDSDDEPEDTNSSAFVPRNQDHDIQLIYALKFLNGEMKIGDENQILEDDIKAQVETEWDELQAKKAENQEKQDQPDAEPQDEADQK